MSGAILVCTAVTACTAGAANSLLSRIVMSTECDAACNPGSTVPQLFTKPVFVTAIAFAAMAASLLFPIGEIVFAVLVKISRTVRFREASDAEREDAFMRGLLFEGDADVLSTPVRIKHVQLMEPPPRPTWRGCCDRYSLLIMPTALDLVATGLQNAAVLFITAGVNASMRGSLLLFTGISAWAVGSRDGAASPGEWVGIGVSVFGCTLAGVACLLDGGTEAGAGGIITPQGWTVAAAAALGLALSVASNALQGGQVAVETVLLQGSVFSATETNGVEGLLGLGILVTVLAIMQSSPGGVDNGHVEDSLNTLCCLTSSYSGDATLVLLVVALAVAFTVSTTAFMALSRLRGGNFRSLLMVGRAVLVWIAELSLYYGPSGATDGYGQPFRQYDWLQGVGFALLIAGGVITWRFQSAREAEEGRGVEGEGYDGFSERGEDEDGALSALSPFTPAGITAVPMESNLKWTG